MPIPLSQPDLTQQDIDAVVEVLNSSTLSMGLRTRRFEELCARHTGRRYGVAVSSGSAALHCTLTALGLEEGDEVITTPFSFVATTNAILQTGARPVFVDIDPVTLNMDIEKVAAAVTPRTRAIVPVEVFGHPGGMIELEQIAQQHELVLIEDAGAGFGGQVDQRRIGSFGRAGVFGFYPNKQITTGEGGVIVTDDDTLADVCRSLRNHGREGMGWISHQRLGFNYRLSELNAALGVAQIERLDEILERRRRVAHQYIDRLMTNRYLILPTIDRRTRMSWFVFVVRLNDLFEPGDRDEIVKQLRREGIGSSNYFPPIHLQPYIANRFGHQPGDFPMTEHVSARTLALPFFNRITSAQITRVCDTLDRMLEQTLMDRPERF